jgi:hypothetical protein
MQVTKSSFNFNIACNKGSFRARSVDFLKAVGLGHGWIAFKYSTEQFTCPADTQHGRKTLIPNNHSASMELVMGRSMIRMETSLMDGQ